ncbi:hypothetical protein [Micromonospora humida]|uniref:Uncharacterized protein n=1 Tax=Micromonospora humida TaxID=2809018 RepID=A0ABS2ISM3_9ACTN|nr:hypothetical protein [Micromonospora humida]MBM7077330.1 hypothetical protein [Micromonospora humida]
MQTGDHVSGALQDLCTGTVRLASRGVADFVPADRDWSLLQMLGSDVLIAHRVDEAEHDRRQRDGLGALLSSDHLELLMSLPVGWPVPVPSLSHCDQRTLRRMPRGSVRIAAGAAERLAVRPARVDLAVVPARRWRAGLERAGRFAPFTARMMWLQRMPLDVDIMVRESRRFGVGVMVGPSEQAEVLVPPAPFIQRRFTAAGWLFTEQAYQQLR